MGPHGEHVAAVEPETMTFSAERRSRVAIEPHG
eukprot:CAMPEP_0115468838 /NCGR_PEP_ID=MMETSP0271-20121206/51165_1 /TAXON_ID=71861 /ORGANISM="Scrippsiella trochoidea, Strain CCMP3099" /LENGTH=32 /DNA_ID= /DNA_START= /DNA_END= /DNA_ORIENTATION=